MSDIAVARYDLTGSITPLLKHQPTYIHHQLLGALDRVQDPAGLKFLITPTNRSAQELRQSLARLGRPVANLEAVTPFGLARHVLEVCHPASAMRMVNAVAGRIQMESFIVGHDLHQKELLRRSAGSVYDAIQELRLEGVNVELLRSRAGSDQERDLAVLLEAHESWLDANDLVDGAGLLTRARNAMEEFVRRRRPDLVMVLDEVRLSIPEREMILVLGMAATRVFRIGFPEAGWPADSGSALFPQWEYPDGEVLASTEYCSDLIEAIDRAEEVRTVFLDIIKHAIPLDQVQVVIPSRDPYEEELIAAGRRYDIPVDTGARRMSRTPGGAALRAVLLWVAQECSLGDLVSMMKAGHVRSVDAATIRVLETGPHGMGLRMGDVLVRAVRMRAMRRGIHAEPVEAALAVLKCIQSISPPSGDVPAGDLLPFLERWQSQFAPEADSSTDSVDTIYRTALHALELPARESSLGIHRFATLAADVVETLFLPVSSSETGAISVVREADAGWGLHARRYVVGLDDQSVDEFERTDSLLPDVTRTRLSMNGAARVARVSRTSRVAEILRRGKTVLCLPSFDVASGRHLYPGSALVSLMKVSSVRPRRAPGVLDEADAVFSVPGPGARALLHALFPLSQRSHEALIARRSGKWTSYSGVVEEVAGTGTYSPSALEDLSSCPYRYFLGRVLKISPPVGGPDQDWMERHEEGELLHEVFEEHTRRRIRGEADLGEQDAVWLEQLVDAKLAAFENAAPAPSSLEVEIVSRRLKTAIRVYLVSEQGLADQREPIAAEFRFGTSSSAQAPPLEVTFSGGSMAITGRVDRIDRLQDGSLVVTDFKTGSAYAFNGESLDTLESHLQWAIYALAVASHFGVPVALSGYVFTSVKELGLRHERAPVSQEQVGEVLGALMKFPGSGFFPQAVHPGGACMFCDFRPVCGDLDNLKEEVESRIAQAGTAGFEDLVRNWNYARRRIS